MKIPKRVNICGTNWAIKHKWNLRDDDGQLAHGLCDKDAKTIYLDRPQDKDDQANTLMHEIVHAVCYELKLHQTSLTSDVEEIIAQGIADFVSSSFQIRWRKDVKK